MGHKPPSPISAAGKPILAHTLKIFEDPEIQEVTVVVHPEDLICARKGHRLTLRKCCAWCPG
jgi:2-C-methyl-D-erythritol 4-phosphate cytidylyltransferase